MRKKWGMILGLTGMMILGSQGIYAAETADSTAETAEAESTEPADDVEMKETDKDMENTVDIESRIKKVASLQGFPYTIRPSSRITELTIFLAPTWSLRSPQT